MNQFDIAPQNLSRRAEAASTRNPLSPEGGRGSSADGTFNSLLEGLAGEAPQEGGTDLPLAGKTGVADADLAAETPSGSTMAGDLLQSILPAESATGEMPPQGSNPVLSVLEVILPRILDGQNRSADATQSGAPYLRAGLNGIGQQEDGGSLSNIGQSPALRVSVQHQETHFRPIVEELSLQGPLPASARPDDHSEPIMPGSSAGKPESARMKELRSELGLVSNSTPSQIGFEAAPGERGHSKGDGLGRGLSQVDMLEHGIEVGSKSEATASLPTSTLHRIAGAVLAEVRPMAAAMSLRSTQADGSARLTLTKASEGVLRVLNLQLQPAELGLVTIKMRLAGDNLEMELQVSSEETAQLLRNDTEKLSGLLRGSGYRPDVISIHVGQAEATQHDGSAPQKQPSTSQSQHQGFQHGASNQEGRSRPQDDRYGNERAETRNGENEDRIPHARNSGGIYL